MTAAKYTQIDPQLMLAEQLEEDIALGRLKPRERLVEDELMLRFGVKRNVVRQALADLEVMGIVEKPRNKGALVRDFTPLEVMQLYVVREILERKAAELIPFPAAPDIVAELKQIHAQHMAAAQHGQLALVFRKNLLFHRVFFEACGNPALAEAVEIYQMKSHAIRSYSIADSTLLERVTRDHAAIIQALENQDRAELIRLVVAHMVPAREAYLRVHAH